MVNKHDLKNKNPLFPQLYNDVAKRTTIQYITSYLFVIGNLKGK